MKIISFHEIFEGELSRRDEKKWTCKNVLLLRKNFIFSEKCTNFYFLHEFNPDVPEQDAFGVIDADDDVYIDNGVEISSELYLLNISLKKAHPVYQVLFDEMLEKEKPTFWFSLDYYERIVLSIEVYNSDYWFAGASFKYTFNLWDFKFLDLEDKEKQENANI